jgi:hypothetical protein
MNTWTWTNTAYPPAATQGNRVEGRARHCATAHSGTRTTRPSGNRTALGNGKLGGTPRETANKITGRLSLFAYGHKCAVGRDDVDRLGP